MKDVSVPMSSGKISRRWKIIAGLAAGVGLLILALCFTQGTPGGGSSKLGSAIGVRSALAGDFTGKAAADRTILGLFSESVTSNLKVKYPSSQWSSVRNVRLFANWSQVERRKGKPDWSSLDAEINSTLSLGVNSILLTLTGPVPSWAQNRELGKLRWTGPPKDIKNWYNYCRSVANRYKKVVDYYQIWQEPGWDLDAPPAAGGVVYYASYCDFTYMGLLRAGYQGVKSVQPDAYVASGSMMNGITRSANDFKNYETLLAGGNQDVSMKITSGQNIVAERPMYFNYHGQWPDGTTELGTTKPLKRWYLAEGATYSGFEEWICVQNPNKVDTGVNITYMFPGGATQQQYFTMKANSRFTVNVNEAVGANRDVSARIDAAQPVVVERPMYFKYHGKWTGGSIGSGVASPQTQWYMAEGATQPGFEEWISLMNPSSSATNVTITYMFKGGQTRVQKLYMSKTSRQTVNVNAVVGPNKDVSAKVVSNVPIIAERPMYFLYHGAWPGGDTQVGAPQPQTSWLFAEGTTRNNSTDGAFEEWISIMNPGDAPANVGITYMYPGGGTQAGSKTVGAHSRETILVNSEIGNNKDVSVQLNSSQPIIAERPMYFDYHMKITGGDVELGCQGGSKTWYFAEGTTREGFEEWATLMNPTNKSDTATITYMFPDGTTQQQSVGLPPKSRTTVGVNNSLSMATICDGIAVHPYDYPEYWAWYYQNVVNICAKNGYGGKEVVVTEIGWPHAGRAEFSREGQRKAIGEVGVGGLWGAGCRKIWIFEDVDPLQSWDQAFNGLYDHNGNAMPAWNEYKKWQARLPNYGNKPSTFKAP
ncbi:MAG TPA: hypothetical protein VIK22_04945 [Candidatus Anoxymicrobiaceae bacterium]